MSRTRDCRPPTRRDPRVPEQRGPRQTERQRRHASGSASVSPQAQIRLGGVSEDAAIQFPGETTEYRVARDRLLDAEIELRRAIERVAAQRRALPPGGAV